MRWTPRPCSGADSRSLLPSLAAEATTCSHPTTRRRTHARTQRGGRREGPEPAGRAGPLVKTSGKRGKRLEQERPVGSQPALLPQPPAVPRGRRWARCLRPTGVVSGPPRGRGGRVPLPQGAGWSGPGRTLRHWGKDWVTPDIWLVLCRSFLPEDHPFSRTLCSGRAALEPWGLFEKRGLELPAPFVGPGLTPLLPAQGPAHPVAPHLLSLHLSGSRAGSRPVCQRGLLGPPALWACAGPSGMPVRGGGAARGRWGPFTVSARPRKLPGRARCPRGAERGARWPVAGEVGAEMVNSSGQRAGHRVQAGGAGGPGRRLGPLPWGWLGWGWGAGALV